MDELQVLINLNTLGEHYQKNLLEDKKTNNPESNWWNGLNFFFNRAFDRGRNDRLSHKYRTFTIKVLLHRYKLDQKNLIQSFKLIQDDDKHNIFDKSIINDIKTNPKSNALKNKSFNNTVAQRNDLIQALFTEQQLEIDYTEFDEGKKLEKVHLGLDKDYIMVLDTLKFICSNEPNNIYIFLKNSIKKDGFKSTFDYLTDGETGIDYIGDKLGTFVIRDMVLMDPDLLKYKGLDYRMMFPVDRWVRRIHKKLTHRENTKDIQIKDDFIEKCGDDFSPPIIAAGLWYLSFKSLDLLVNNLDKIEILLNND